MTRRLRVSLILLLYSFFANAQEMADLDIVKDLKSEWFVYEKSSGEFLPYTSSEDDIESIYFVVDGSSLKERQLVIDLVPNSSLFIENLGVAYFEEGVRRNFSGDSLIELYGEDDILFTIYSPGLRSEQIQTLVTSGYITGEYLSNAPVPVEYIERQSPVLNDFLIISGLAIIIFVTILIRQYPRIIADFYNLFRTVGFRSRDELLYNTKLLDKVNMRVYIFLSAVIAFFLVTTTALSGMTNLDLSDFRGSLLSLIVYWLSLTGIILFIVMLKFLLVDRLIGLFRLFEFRNIHVINDMRFTLITFSGMSVLMVFIYLGIKDVNPGTYFTLIQIVVALLFLRILFLFFKLLNFSSYRIMHLFSYLCATELIPFVVIFKLIIS